MNQEAALIQWLIVWTSVQEAWCTDPGNTYKQLGIFYVLTDVCSPEIFSFFSTLK